MSDSTAYPDDALAIVGLACRLPGGVNTLSDLWSALSAGQSLISDVPPDRFDTTRFLDRDLDRAGKSFTFAGGYIDDLGGFDADYFGISPREAALMDPQQRLLLELTADAFDDAAIDPASVAGTDTAVFVGMSDMGYLALQMYAPDTIASHTMTGGALSIASNRLSYVFDLRGPSMTLDTACSSAMVAFHQACQTILSGRSSLAVVGGVHALLGPHPFIAFAKAKMLSPLGRCATFSADADGYVRAEGGGVFLVKRLSAALADGDRVHAVILATHVNSDGRTSGMTVPSADVQEALLREVYARAGLRADDLSYLEAHGTGTPIGDPIECEAIGRALGRYRSVGHLLPIGSVKTNLGHMEPASGIAGILKAILVLGHRQIPPSLHGAPPNPAIDFSALGLAPVNDTRGIEPGRAVVGVNSSGFGGTNAHAVLAEAPVAPATARPIDGELPLVMSARSEPALAEAVNRLAHQLEGSAEEDFYDICYTAARRAGHAHRAVVLASTPRVAAERLAAVGRHEPGGGEACGPATTFGRVVFMFSGNGSQWPTMGADLLDSEPVFRAAVEEVDRLLRPRLAWSVLGELTAPPETSRLRDTAVGQPALFALQAGLVAMLADCGIRPAAVMGHSVGEVAAAYAAGALDLEAACRVIAARAGAQAGTAGQGRMAAVGLSRSDAEQAMRGLSSGQLEIAAVNTDSDVTVSGDTVALAELRSRLDETVFFRELDLDHAFHGRGMDCIEGQLRTGLCGLCPSATTVPFVSTVTGGPIGDTPLDADYWWANVRRPVLFVAATRYLHDEGFDVFVEIGPHPVLAGYLRRMPTPNTPTTVVPTLRRHADGPVAIRTAAAAVMAAGAPVDDHRYFPQPGRVVDLPSYPWQRRHHWQGTPGQWVRSSGDGTIDHPMLGERMGILEPVWLGTIEPALLPWLASHKVAGTVLMPAVGYVEMALAAGRRVLNDAVEITDLAIPAPLPLPWGEGMDVRIQTSMSADDGVIRIASATGTERDWRLHAQGRVRRLLGEPPPPVDLTALRADTTKHWDADGFYRLLEGVGLDYGPYFQVLHDVYLGPGQVLARYRSSVDQDGYEVHPAILDGALHAGMPLLEGRPFLPGAVDRFRLWRQPLATGFVFVRQRSRTQREACWDILVGDEDGTVVAELSGCRMRRAGVEQAPPARYVTVLRAATRRDEPAAPSPLPGPRDLVAAAGEAIDDLTARWDQPAYERVKGMAKEATAHIARAALDTMLPGQEELTTEDLLAAGMLPKYVRLWQLVAALCEQHGLLERRGAGRWRMTAQDTTPPREFAQSLLLDLPQYGAEVLARGRMAANWADLLTGRSDPLGLLFGDGGSDTMEHLYDASPIARGQNGLALSLLRAMVEKWPSDRPLRVLEVGAGTGGTSAKLLPVLPPERARYVFTDASSAFFVLAESRFKRYPFVEYCCLDIDTDLQEQGFGEGTFDVVVASHVLHVAQDLRRSLGRLGRLLAPNGLMLASEFHDADMLVGSVGFLDQFWSFTDSDLRPTSPLLSRDQWSALLGQCGFDEVVQCGVDDGSSGADFSVTLARWPHQPMMPTFPPPALPGSSWTVAVEDPGDVDRGYAVAGAISTAGGDALVVIAADHEEDWLAERLRAGGSIVFVLGGEDEDGADAVARAVRRFGVLRSFATVCQTFPPRHGTTLWLVTRPSGALPEPELPLAPADAAVWGAARVLANERAGYVIKRISWERSDDVQGDADRLAFELLSPSDEDEVVLTRGGRFVPRQIERQRPLRPVSRHERGYELEIRHQGLSYELAWVEASRPTPAPDELVIEVAAAALNYMDVMIAIGSMPPEVQGAGAGGDQVPGLECAGVVAEVGSDVRAFRPGDRVCAVAARAFASHVVTKAAMAVRVPDDMDLVHATTLPVAFLTVHYSLDHLARLAPGETVLVHGAAGGVGLAAIQHAKGIGASVIATAGTPAKRTLLSLLGVEQVLDSRSLAFADQVRALTGSGVDVVLNSLSGEAIPRGLELLRPYGRFVELGKRDIYANSRVALRAFRDNISLFCVDVSQLATVQPALARSQVQEIARRVAAGQYRPLLHRAYPAGRVAEAFRLMQHSRHIGKLVITFDHDDPVAVECSPTPIRLDRQSTYLVTGGLSGLGAAVARGLGRWGARHIALVGRRGLASPEAPDLIDDLARQGVDVSAFAADAADPVAMAAVIAAVDGAGHPLRGVIHAAMQLDDGQVPELGDERFRAVLAPKMQGGMVLDALTRDRPLDFFVAFSSMTALVGTLNQANYSAGNLFLEALMRARHHAGRPALAAAWAGISDIGYVARQGLRDSLTGLGLLFLTPEQALDALGELLGLPDTVVGVGGMDWGRLSAMLPLVKSPRLADLLPPLIEGTEYRLDEFARILSESAPDDARRLVRETLVKIVAGILRSSPDRVNRSRPLAAMGMDSLMTVELLATTAEQFQCDIPLAELVNSALTIDAVAELILIRLDVQSGPSIPDAMIVTARDLDSIPAGER